MSKEFKGWWHLFFAGKRKGEILNNRGGMQLVAFEAWKAAQQSWRPIETAPAYTRVLLCAGDEIFTGQVAESRRLYDTLSPTSRHPTHWQPLPEPPSE